MNDVIPAGPRALARRGLVLGAAGALLLGTASGVAYAAWAVTATGSSSAASGEMVTGMVTPATPVEILYPGNSTAVYFTVSNPNDFPVTYTMADFGTVSVDDATACPPANLTVQDMTVSIPVAADTTSTVQSPAGAIRMASDAPTGCQGRTFTVATTLTGTSGSTS